MRNLRSAFALVPLLAGLAGIAVLGQQSISAQEKGTDKPVEKPVEKPKADKPAEKPVAKEAGADKSDMKVAELGKAAPDFTLKDLDGKTVKLSDYKGKTVVLEWFNPECPVVVGQHGKGVLKEYPAKAMADGVVWLAINSGAAGMQGHDPETNKKMRGEWKMGYPVLLDASGDIGRAYGAKTTPHMFVIDPKGTLVYRGAIDNAARGEPEGGKLVNHVEAALADLKAGKPVATADTKAYGCGVKYAKPGS